MKRHPIFLEQGLPPLPDTSKDRANQVHDEKASSSNEKPVAESRSTSLSFSSSGPAPRGFAKKRKTVGDDLDDLLSKESKAKTEKKGKQSSKAKKAKTGALLSFGDDDT